MKDRVWVAAFKSAGARGYVFLGIDGIGGQPTGLEERP
jgi:hypothetical protein